MNIKKILAGVTAGAVMMASLAVPVLAASDTGYGSQPGSTVSQENTTCAGHGAFGAFSHHTGTWIPQDAQEDPGLGAATGPANSGLCGNPQN